MQVTMRSPDLVRRGLLPVINGEALCRANDFSTWKLSVNGNDSRWERFGPGWGVEIRNQNGNLLLSGPATEIKETADANSRLRTVEIVGVSDDIHLADSLVIPNPPAGATAASDLWKATGAAETVLRRLVSEQIGPAAPASYKIPTLRLETDGARGPSISISERFTNLLEVLQLQCQTASLQFRIRQVGTTIVLSFGTPRDLRRAVRLSRENAGVGAYTLTDTAPTATEAIVGGVGTGSTRKMWRVARDPGPWGRRVTSFVDRQSTSDTNELQQAAESELDGKGRKTSVTFDARDTNRLMYGRNFLVGDKITADLDGAQVSDTLQIAEIRWDAKGVSSQLQIGPTADETKLNTATGSLLELYKKVRADIRRNQTR